MTDSAPWQSPSGSPNPSPPEPEAFGSPDPASQQPAAGPGGAPGWTPPPKPGLIPLRPLTLGTLLAAAFQVMRRNPKPTFGFSLLVNSVVIVIGSVAIGLVVVFATTRIGSASTEDADAIAAGAVAQVWLALLVPILLALVVTAVLQGVISLEVARATLGEKLTLGGLWRQAKGRIGSLIGWMFLIVAVAAVALTVLALLVGVVIAVSGEAGLVIGILLAIFSYLALIVVGFWLGTRVSLVPSVIMIERSKVVAAVRRSWSLTIGYFWKTLGIQLLVGFILGIVGQVVTIPISFLAPLFLTLFNPSGDNTGLMVTLVIVSVVSLLVILVYAAISSVVQAATAALIYVDLRMRKEGLDLELARFVEARQRSDSSLLDPYLVAPTTAGAAPPDSPPAGASPWA